MLNRDTQIQNAIKFSDIKFERDGNGGIKTLVNEDAIKASIDNILNTRKGERVMRSDFGAGLYEHIFDLMDSDLNDFFAVQIKQSIEQHDKRVEVLAVKYKNYPDENKVDVIVYFAMRGMDQAYQAYQYTGTFGG
jgi:phage baseplate assembly protein W